MLKSFFMLSVTEMVSFQALAPLIGVDHFYLLLNIFYPGDNKCMTERSILCCPNSASSAAKMSLDIRVGPSQFSLPPVIGGLWWCKLIVYFLPLSHD